MIKINNLYYACPLCKVETINKNDFGLYFEYFNNGYSKEVIVRCKKCRIEVTPLMDDY